MTPEMRPSALQRARWMGVHPRMNRLDRSFTVSGKQYLPFFNRNCPLSSAGQMALGSAAFVSGHPG
jgi:hypothetical protein